jgi:hypothetical protein
VNPHKEGAVSWFFRYSQGASCISGESNVTPVNEASGEAIAAEARIAGLSPGTKYTFCLVAEAEGLVATGNPISFNTKTAVPSISNEAASGPDSSEATITALINAEGSPTTYKIEYGLGETTEATAERSVGAPTTPVPIQVKLSHLESGALYHFRVTASNPFGATNGVGGVFTTAKMAPEGGGKSSCPNANLVGFSSALPDCRAYELVSSATAAGEVYTPAVPGVSEPQLVEDTLTEHPFRAASDGNAIAFVAAPGSSGGNGAEARDEGNEYLARRPPGGNVAGWLTEDIMLPTAEGELAIDQAEAGYLSFSSDLSVGIFTEKNLRAPTEPTAPPNCYSLYSHTSDDGRNHALFSHTETPGWCGRYISRHFPGGSGFFVGEAADHSQQFLQTIAALNGEASEASGIGFNLYDASGGALRLVDVLPTGVPVSNATFGGPSNAINVFNERINSGWDFDHAVAENGSAVYWSTLAATATEAPTRIYVRENPSRPQSPLGPKDECLVATDACTLAVSAGPANFMLATANGGSAFYTEGEELWRFALNSDSRELVSGLGVNGEVADVRGVIGSSEDGTYIYFVAQGALSRSTNIHHEVAIPRRCESSGSSSEEHGTLPPGQGCNLYVWHAGEPVKFIAALAAHDDEQQMTEQGIGGDWSPNLAFHTARVTPDGLHVVFESEIDLTGYSTATLPADSSEIFRYDVITESLSCVSCSLSGTPPASEGKEGSGTHLAVSLSETFQPRVINDRGDEVFFESSQPLVSQVSNAPLRNVYEWEASTSESALSSCSRSSPSFSGFDEGCIFLLSGGTGSDDSYFLDASSSGEDVFLTHRGPLGQAGPADDKNYLYDIRAGGGIAETRLACTGTGCQGVPPTAPMFATPPSVTFSGTGNLTPSSAPTGGARRAKPLTRAEQLAKALKACKRNRSRKGRKSCERRARKHYRASRTFKKKETHR